jgi:hypothetical protein
MVQIWYTKDQASPSPTFGRRLELLLPDEIAAYLKQCHLLTGRVFLKYQPLSYSTLVILPSKLM